MGKLWGAIGLCALGLTCVALLAGLSAPYAGPSELLGGDAATLAARELLLTRLRSGLAEGVSAERVEGSKVFFLCRPSPSISFSARLVTRSFRRVVVGGP